MNPSLLHAFRQELHFLREVGAEFAQAHPQHAASLAPPGDEADPFVERLLQGVAFLTAKTACRLDNEAERLADDVLSAVMPDLLVPLPPASMVQFCPLGTLRAEAHHEVPRGSPVRHASQALGDISFRTVSSVQILPLHLEVLEPPSPQALIHALQAAAPAGGWQALATMQVLRVELRTLAGQPLGRAVRNRLPIFCAGDHAFRLWTALTQQSKAMLWVSSEGRPVTAALHSASRLVPSDWHDGQSLIPESMCLPGPYRLLREWCHWPERFLFGDLLGLQDGLKALEQDRVELWWLVPPGALPPRLDPQALRLFCTPAVNCESVRAEPIALHATESQYPVRLPQPKRKTHRIVGIERVECRSATGGWQELAPLHKAFGAAGDRQYAVRRLVGASDDGLQELANDSDWLIAPSVFNEQQQAWSDLMSVSLWTQHRKASHISADDLENWRLDVAAPVLATHGLGPVLRGQAVPQPSTGLLRAAASRFDLMRTRSDAETARDLQTWLKGVTREFAWPVTRGLKACWTVRRVPWTPAVVYAQGYSVDIDLDGDAAVDERLAGMMHVVAATICRQPGMHGFVVLRCTRRAEAPLECVVWR